MAKLEDYKKKRDFGRTKEPKGTSRSGSSKRLRFVVQRHHASRLHYDLRLELDGVLKSWAVPKGPSLNPKDRRLAVQVEDHPIDYGSFEGIIPKGNYGAGVVTIFDSGYYDFVESKDAEAFLEKLEKGSAKFRLHGNILKGEFALVRMQGESDKSWLLIKHDDKYATEEAFNSENFVSAEIKEEGKVFKKKKSKFSIADKKEIKTQKDNDPPTPMAALLAENIHEGEWTFEKKYDGFRIISIKEGDEIKLYSRNGNRMDRLFPSLIRELSQLDRSAIIDGEVVIEDKSGKPAFQLLKSGEPVPDKMRLYYYAFDLLRLDNEDLTDYSLSDRQDVLELLLTRLKKRTVIQDVERLFGAPTDILIEADKLGWEGVMAKDKESRYLIGKRSSLWLKIKFRKTQEAVICGYTAPQGSRSHFGALVLGVYEAGKLRYIGNCGTGFSDHTLGEIHSELEKIKISRKPFVKGVTVAKEKEVTWVRPLLVCEVYYAEWTADQHLRHSVFKGLRLDKEKDEVKIERPLPMVENDKTLQFGRKKVSLTNLQKVYWPKEGHTKGEMVTYYEEMSDYLLPFIKDKPLSLHRFPNGIEQAGFFQKDMDKENIPPWVKTAAMYSESTDKEIDYIVCNDSATLLYVANLGSVEINPWLSTYRKPDKPDFAVLDLDPNGAPFEKVVEVAQSSYEVLKHADITPYLKTSGSTGLHIYIYLDRQYTYDIIRNFMEWVAQSVHEMHPDSTSMVRNPQKRKGLIYLDYLQNRRGQTVVAPYSLRPRPGATASTPLFWEELGPDLHTSDHTIHTLPLRMKRMDDPWKTIWENPVNIKEILSKL